MDRLKKLIRESLVAHLNEADSKKKDDVIVPEGCFGGPKHHIGALVNIVELLMLEKIYLGISQLSNEINKLFEYENNDCKTLENKLEEYLEQISVNNRNKEKNRRINFVFIKIFSFLRAIIYKYVFIKFNKRNTILIKKLM